MSFRSIKDILAAQKLFYHQTQKAKIIFGFDQF